ncbi:hypothetical protein IC235_07990 [Hymenobacter sp. BT664]|uniref:Uncharacterized protein n=1 Tax=Hymenobacter montanus TaxID=2771359 RepID=A0A927GIV8_9BACT|nr:hypothetical protein [Hymenobacter montanus]MBD2767832.1 hypothetical protein [Hymenobacter montanus]
MPFEVLPVLDAMLELYEKPRDQARFQAYLQLLGGGTKADLAVPVLHFNPMAKEPFVAKLRDLVQLKAEGIAAQTLRQLNLARSVGSDEPLYRVALNLADDLQGGWTNRYTTDYANKFNIGPLLKRGFCTPLFWAGEDYTPALVQQRVLAQAWRTRYRAQHPQPRTVAEHLAQERFVTEQISERIDLEQPVDDELWMRYQVVQHATDTPTLLTFFYGDAAAQQLGYQTWGNWPAEAGFRLAQIPDYQARPTSRKTRLK